MVETRTDRKVKRLRSNNGGEYKNDQFHQTCRDEGIVRHFTIRHTQQQNRVAKRMNQTILEKVQCMLPNARWGKEFWAEVVVYACHMINRFPSATIEGKVQCMLPNAGWGKEFWAEAVVYACHMINRLPSATIEGKTIIEKWTGKPATNYNSLHVFGSIAYYHVKE